MIRVTELVIDIDKYHIPSHQVKVYPIEDLQTHQAP
jgi:hypothetical protein